MVYNMPEDCGECPRCGPYYGYHECEKLPLADRLIIAFWSFIERIGL